MKTIPSLHVIVTALSMAISSVALGATSANWDQKDNYKIYPIRCNSANIDLLDRQAAIYEVWQRMHDHGNQVDFLATSIRGLLFTETCAGPGEVCARVTVTAFQSPGLWFKANNFAIAL